MKTTASKNNAALRLDKTFRFFLGLTILSCIPIVVILTFHKFDLASIPVYFSYLTCVFGVITLVLQLAINIVYALNKQFKTPEEWMGFLSAVTISLMIVGLLASLVFNFNYQIFLFLLFPFVGIAMAYFLASAIRNKNYMDPNYERYLKAMTEGYDPWIKNVIKDDESVVAMAKGAFKAAKKGFCFNAIIILTEKRIVFISKHKKRWSPIGYSICYRTQYIDLCSIHSIYRRPWTGRLTARLSTREKFNFCVKSEIHAKSFKQLVEKEMIKNNETTPESQDSAIHNIQLPEYLKTDHKWYKHSENYDHFNIA